MLTHPEGAKRRRDTNREQSTRDQAGLHETRERSTSQGGGSRSDPGEDHRSECQVREARRETRRASRTNSLPLGRQKRPRTQRRREREQLRRRYRSSGPEGCRSCECLLQTDARRQRQLTLRRDRPPRTTSLKSKARTRIIDDRHEVRREEVCPPVPDRGHHQHGKQDCDGRPEHRDVVGWDLVRKPISVLSAQTIPTNSAFSERWTPWGALRVSAAKNPSGRLNDVIVYHCSIVLTVLRCRHLEEVHQTHTSTIHIGKPGSRNDVATLRAKGDSSTSPSFGSRHVSHPSADRELIIR